MVANLLKLRFLVLRNTLLRNKWQLVAVIIGALYGVGILVLIVVGLAVLGTASLTVISTVVVLAGSAVVVGWVLFPLILSGIDQTLDPQHLSIFPIRTNTLLVGLGLSGILGIPGIVTTVAALATAGTWATRPGVAIVALICGAIAALTCVIASRAITALSASFSSGRRFRELSGIVILIPLVFVGPIIISVTSGLKQASDALPALAQSLSWTPIGAIWAVPAAVAAGDTAGAILRFLIGVAFAVVLVAIWRWALIRALVTPAHSSSRQRGVGRLGWFARFPATPTGAVAARALTYWMRDPRYTRQLVILPLLPALMIFYSTFIHATGIILAMGPAIAFLVSISIFTDLSYDSTAFALHISTGLKGSADRAGRVIAVTTFALPIVVVLTIVSVWVANSWAALPALLGLSVGVLLTGLAISSVTSALFVFPVPAPGDSPFKARQGANLTTSLTTFAVWGVLAVLALPEIGFVIAFALTGNALFGWLALAVGAVLGTVLLIIGVRQGGRVLDRNATNLLTQLRRDR